MMDGELKKRIREEVVADQTDTIGALDCVYVETVEKILDEAAKEFPESIATVGWYSDEAVQEVRKWFSKWFPK